MGRCGQICVVHREKVQRRVLGFSVGGREMPKRGKVAWAGTAWSFGMCGPWGSGQALGVVDSDAKIQVTRFVDHINMYVLVLLSFRRRITERRDGGGSICLKWPRSTVPSRRKFATRLVPFSSDHHHWNTRLPFRCPLLLVT